MKKLCWSVVCICIMVWMTSCKKETEIKPSEATAFFTCKINGQLWESAEVQKEVLLRTEERPGLFFKTLILSGTSEDGVWMTVHLYNMYEAETGDCPGVYTYYGSGHEDYEALAHSRVVDGVHYGDHCVLSYFSPDLNISGSGFDDVVCTISECEDYKVSGHFEGTVKGQSEHGTFTMKITEGVFENIPYVIME